MSTVFLIPSFISPEAKTTIPPYVIDALKQCQVIFAENCRTARRFMKSMDAAIVIDAYEWHEIQKAEVQQIDVFDAVIRAGKSVAIISEAGCPGVADPGQQLILRAHALGCNVRPLVGPSALLLAIMASGMNGQQFEFVGYLPIDQHERAKRIKELEANSARYQSTKLFIETPYRNETLWSALLQHCQPSTLLCIARDLTGIAESIQTKSVNAWKKINVEFTKVPAVFLLYAGDKR